MSKILLANLEDGIFQLQIDDPENENRLSEELCDELMTALTHLATEPSLKVLILSGRADVFCAGASLDTIKQVVSGNADVKDLSLPNQLLSFPVPIIAALQGHAVGGGIALALYCDILIASENSRYGLNFTDLGFTPGMGILSVLPAMVGHHFASEMLLTAKLYKGKELKGRGLFNYIVPAEEVMTLALDMARRIAEKPRHVLEMVKDTLSLPRRQALQAALSREHLMHKICFGVPGTLAHIEAAYLA
ncbi:MAG: enoyl-CoA hydratase/isomerase family protein [Nostoc sp. JL31]|uniref:polyketide synthase n=1 Tax=Nostoc sp. JL31 TaxID=2815395 RepID=UPI0025EAA246|nr:polyketide synthase [Nostoc sp. JL31]MBN3888589.1 enoyl-CoA hydratase/isomerase family protein [Nostoc sp. JL31]